MNITKRLSLLLLLIVSATGCAISHHTDPLNGPIPANVCIAENKLVLRPEFLPALVDAFKARGIDARAIPASYSQSGNNLIAKWNPADATGCETIATYNARWTWDLSLYLVYANVRVYRDNKIIGNAEYDARWGGFRLDKYASASSKLGDLMDRLLLQKGTTAKSTAKDSSGSAAEITSEPQIIKQTSASQNADRGYDPQADTAVKLKKLKELYEAGLITKEEYELKRSKIIDNL